MCVCMCINATCVWMCTYFYMYKPEQHQVFCPVSFLRNCSRQVLSVNLEPTAWLNLLSIKLWESICLCLFSPGLGPNPLNFSFLKQVLLGIGTEVLMLAQQALTPQPMWSRCQSPAQQIRPSILRDRQVLCQWVTSAAHFFAVVWVFFFF